MPAIIIIVVIIVFFILGVVTSIKNDTRIEDEADKLKIEYYEHPLVKSAVGELMYNLRMTQDYVDQTKTYGFTVSNDAITIFNSFDFSNKGTVKSFGGHKIVFLERGYSVIDSEAKLRAFTKAIIQTFSDEFNKKYRGIAKFSIIKSGVTIDATYGNTSSVNQRGATIEVTVWGKGLKKI